MMETTAKNLESDEERFHKILLTEQSNFQDKLDDLNMIVAGFSGHTDINKLVIHAYIVMYPSQINLLDHENVSLFFSNRIVG